jgi:cell division protein FtsN
LASPRGINAYIRASSMADNIFRTQRNRDSVAREDIDPTGDPLAELARLIGQSVPRGEERHERYASEDTADPGLDWAAEESYAPEHNRDADRYAPPLADTQSYHQQQDRGRANEPTGGDRFFSGSAARFGGFREPGADDQAADDAGYQDEQELGSVGQRSAGFGASDDRYQADDQQYDDTQAYAAEAYRDAPRRRGGLVVVMAVLGLAVLGTAGAFGYRAMFGGSVLPTLPPIIKPANGPNRIVPSYGDAQTNNSSQGGADTSSSEKLVSHEEQPVDMQEAPRAAPRVVSTIPIAPNQGLAQPGMNAAPSPFNAAPGGAAPPPPVAPASPGSSAQTAFPAPPPAAGQSGPKKVHTVIIRADQPAGADAGAAEPAPPSHAVARPPPPRSTKPPAGTNQPLSLSPGAQGDAPAPASAPAPRPRVATAPTAVATAAPAAVPEAAPASGGGYSVQVSSQRSEADAQAAFHSLQAKFPNQLGGREAVVRRADLGAKGTYYRALVGPFASAEEAAGMCSSLKAAGGNCLVQRN